MIDLVQTQKHQREYDARQKHKRREIPLYARANLPKKDAYPLNLDHKLTLSLRFRPVENRAPR